MDYLRPTCEIILCGDAPGVKEAANEFGITHIPHIVQNKFGTPLLNSAFEKVVEIAKFPLLCFVNADIILINSLIDAIKQIPFRQFIAVGRRTNIEMTKELDFENPNWCSQLVKYATEKGQLATGDWMDCFVFTPNGRIEALLPFPVGRAGWDNWFITNARRNHVPVIDFTRICPIIHQSHDYSHVSMGNNLWSGPEAEYSRELIVKSMGTLKNLGNVWDATHVLTKEYLLPAYGPRYLRQHWYTTVVLHPLLNPIADILNSILRLPSLIKIWTKKIF